MKGQTPNSDQPKSVAPQPAVQPGKAGEPAPSPAVLTQDQIEEIIARRIGETSQRQLEATERLVAGMGEQIVRGLRPQPEAPAKKKTALPTKEELRAAAKRLADDDDPEELVGHIGRTVAATLEEAEEKWDQKFQALAQYGIEQIEQLNTTVGEGKLKFYSKYKAEIDAELASVSPDQRATFKMRKMAHDLVVGRHVAAGDQDLLEALRPSDEDDEDSPSTGQVGRSPRKGPAATANDDLYPEVDPPSKAAIGLMKRELGGAAEGLRGMDVANLYAQKVLGYEDPSGEGQHWNYYQTPSAHGDRFARLLGRA